MNSGIVWDTETKGTFTGSKFDAKRTGTMTSKDGVVVGGFKLLAITLSICLNQDKGKKPVRVFKAVLNIYDTKLNTPSMIV